MSVLLQAVLSKAGYRFWNPNTSNAAMARLIRVSEAEKNGMWLYCFFSLLLLVKEYGGFVVRPIMEDLGPSNMQKVEKMMADSLGVDVIDMTYSRENKFDDLVEKVKALEDDS